MAKMDATTTAVGSAYAGFTTEKILNLTNIDRRFLVQIKEIVEFEERFS